MNNFNYESPIIMEIQKVSQDITDQRENKILAVIQEEIGIKIDKPRLMAALAFDKTECEKSWKNGYDSGYEDATNDILADILPIFGLDISNFKKDDKKEGKEDNEGLL